MLKRLPSTTEEFSQAKELSSKVWSAYCDDQLLESRRTLSILTLMQQKNEEIDDKELANLQSSKEFCVEKKKCRNYCDISYGNYSGKVRRLAALLIVNNLLKQTIQVREKVQSKISNLTGDVSYNDSSPVIHADDIYLALYPVPESPVILPWDEGKSIDAAFAWPTYLKRLKEDEAGDCALKIQDVLAGLPWKEKGTLGLHESERTLLRGLLLDDPELDINEEDLKTYGPARRVLYGVEA